MPRPPLRLLLGAAAAAVLTLGVIAPSLIAVGINGRGAAALRAVRGYDDATGVGSPFRYIQSFRR